MNKPNRNISYRESRPTSRIHHQPRFRTGPRLGRHIAASKAQPRNRASQRTFQLSVTTRVAEHKCIWQHLEQPSPCNVSASRDRRNFGCALRLAINSRTRSSSSICCFGVRGRPLTDRSRLREPSLVSTISSTCFFPYCSFSNRYIQLVWSSWKVSSLVTTRRTRSLADTGLLGTD
jgi:hypothetical protein